MPESWNGLSAQTVFIRKVVIVIAIVGLALLLWRLRDMLLLVFGSVLVAVILRGLAGPLHSRLRISEGVAIGLTILILAVVVGAAAWLFGSEALAQIAALSDILPSAWASFEARIEGSAFGERLLLWARNSAPSGSGVLSGAGQLITSFGSSFADLALVFFGGVYLAAQPNLYRAGALKLLPTSRRGQVGEAIDDSGRALKSWLKGQLLSMTFVAILVGFGLWMLGVPLAFALGAIAGLLDFVPLIGPVVAAVPALLLALSVSPAVAIWTGALYLIVQQFEGNVLSPLVQQHVVDLPPALLLFALLGFGSLFGVIGVILAAPLTVVAYVMVKRLYVRDALETPTSVPGEESK